MIEFAYKSDWGGREAKSRTLVNGVQEGLALHHGASNTVSGFEAEAAALRSYQRFHMDVRGWSDIAYNLAVGMSGTLYALRGLSYRQAATRIYNPTTFAIVAIGNFEEDKPSEAMVASLIEVTDWLVQREKMRREVRTHTELMRECKCGATSCPGKHLYPVADLMEMTASNMPPPTPDPVPPTMFPREMLEDAKATPGNPAFDREYERLMAIPADEIDTLGDIAKAVLFADIQWRRLANGAS